MADFELVSPFQPTGDQPQAIEKLTEGVLDGIRTQVLVGVTGSGKTFSIIEPFIRQHSAKGFSMVVYDYKFV